MIVLSGSSNLPLARQIAQILGKHLGKVEHGEFKNGERRVWVQEEVKGKDIALVQSFCGAVDSTIIEFALMTDALFRLGARRVFAAIPWFGYSLQDKVFRPGEPIAAKVIASMLSSQSIYRFILMNLHNSSMAGFFSVPSSVLSSDEIFMADIREHMAAEPVIVSSDFGGLKRVGRFAQKLGFELANIDKRRDLHTGEVSAHALSGDVSGKHAIIVDDVVNSGATAIEAARILKEHGAKKVSFYATHAIFAGNCAQRLQDSVLDEVIVTNTINQEDNTFAKLRVLSAADLFARELTQWER